MNESEITNEVICAALLGTGMPEFYVHVLKVTTNRVNQELPIDARVDNDLSMQLISASVSEPGRNLEVERWIFAASGKHLVSVAPDSPNSSWEGIEGATWHQSPGDLSPTGPMRTAYAEWRKSIFGDEQPANIPLLEWVQRDFLSATIENAVEYALFWKPDGDLTVFARGLPLCDEQDIVLILHRDVIADKTDRRHVESALH